VLTKKAPCPRRERWRFDSREGVRSDGKGGKHDSYYIHESTLSVTAANLRFVAVPPLPARERSSVYYGYCDSFALLPNDRAN